MKQIHILPANASRTSAGEQTVCDLAILENGQYGRADQNYESYYQAFSRRWGLCSEIQPQEDGLQQHEQARIIEQSAHVATLGMNFGLTDERLLGWIPRRARLGDVICIITGARATLVVRPDGMNYFRLIGEAHIHGVMYGEAMDNVKYQLQDIKIR